MTEISPWGLLLGSLSVVLFLGASRADPGAAALEKAIREILPKATEVLVSDPILPGDPYAFVRVEAPWQGWGGWQDIRGALYHASLVLPLVAASGRADRPFAFRMAVEMAEGPDQYVTLRWPAGSAGQIQSGEWEKAMAFVESMGGSGVAAQTLVLEFCEMRAPPNTPACLAINRR